MDLFVFFFAPAFAFQRCRFGGFRFSLVVSALIHPSCLHMSAMVPSSSWRMLRGMGPFCCRPSSLRMRRCMSFLVLRLVSLLSDCMRSVRWVTSTGRFGSVAVRFGALLDRVFFWSLASSVPESMVHGVAGISWCLGRRNVCPSGLTCVYVCFFLDLCCDFAVACVRGAGCSRVLRGQCVVVEKQTVIFASRFVLGVVRFPAQLACALQIIRVMMWWLVGSVLFLCA